MHVLIILQTCKLKLKTLKQIILVFARIALILHFWWSSAVFPSKWINKEKYKNNHIKMCANIFFIHYFCQSLSNIFFPQKIKYLFFIVMLLTDNILACLFWKKTNIIMQVHNQNVMFFFILSNVTSVLVSPISNSGIFYLNIWKHHFH